MPVVARLTWNISGSSLSSSSMIVTVHTAVLEPSANVTIWADRGVKSIPPVADPATRSRHRNRFAHKWYQYLTLHHILWRAVSRASKLHLNVTALVFQFFNLKVLTFLYHLRTIWSTACHVHGASTDTSCKLNVHCSIAFRYNGCRISETHTKLYNTDSWTASSCSNFM